MALQLINPQKRDEIAIQLHFSYSQLTTYLICPMKYYFQYVIAAEWETKTAALLFETAIHKAVEIYYATLKEDGGIIPLSQVIAVFEAVMDHEVKTTEVPLTFREGENIESLREQGRALLKLFHSERTPPKIVAVEFPFNVKAPDILTGTGDLPVKFIGYFDLVESDRDGTYLIVELKTAVQRFSSLKLEHDLQATVYSFAMAHLELAPSDTSRLVIYDVLLKTKKPALEHYYVTRTEADHKRLVHLINHVLKAIEHRLFYRQTGWQCSDCQFKTACLG
jgi:putative RecB family exonuclease